MFIELLIDLFQELQHHFYLPKLLERSQFPEYMSTLLTLILVSMRIKESKMIEQIILLINLKISKI